MSHSRILDDYGGNALQLTLGDKGAYLYAVFGSPRAHEDDPARAASAALKLRELDTVTAATDVQIGITQGRLRSGTYGHAMRRTSQRTCAVTAGTGTSAMGFSFGSRSSSHRGYGSTWGSAAPGSAPAREARS